MGDDVRVGDMVWGISRKDTGVAPMFVLHHGVVREAVKGSGMVRVDNGLDRTGLYLLASKVFLSRKAAESEVLKMSEDGLEAYRKKFGEVTSFMVDEWEKQVAMVRSGRIPKVDGLVGADGKHVSRRQGRIRRRSLKRAGYIGGEK